MGQGECVSACTVKLPVRHHDTPPFRARPAPKARWRPVPGCAALLGRFPANTPGIPRGSRAHDLPTSIRTLRHPAGQPLSQYRSTVDAGVLSTVRDRRVRSAVERTYLLHSSAATATATATASLDELSDMTPDQHRHMFLASVAGLIGDFDGYLDRDSIDPIRDGVSCRPQGRPLISGLTASSTRQESPRRFRIPPTLERPEAHTACLATESSSICQRPSVRCAATGDG